MNQTRYVDASQNIVNYQEHQKREDESTTMKLIQAAWRKCMCLLHLQMSCLNTHPAHLFQKKVSEKTCMGRRVQHKRWLNMHDLFIPLVNVFHLCATLYTFLHGTNIAATNTAHVSIIHEVSTKHTNTTIMRHLIFMRIFGTKLLWITFSWISHTVWCIRQSNKKKSFPINFHSWYNCVTCREKFIRIQKINKNNTFVQ